MILFSNLKYYQPALYFRLQTQSKTTLTTADGLDVGIGSSEIKSFVREGVGRILVFRVGGGGQRRSKG